MKTTEYEYDEYEKLFDYKRKQVRSRNEYRIEGKIVYVVLTGIVKKPTMICDLDDWERLKDYVWHCCKSGGYAVTNVVKKGEHTIVKFHQIVMGQKKGFLIDHINRNPLDNRKENLRFVTPTANLVNKGISDRNTSGYKGVSWRKESGKWRAQIWVNKKAINLGCYDTKEEAINARREAEEKYHNPLFEEK